MKLRYVVELETSPTFTAVKRVKTPEDADKKVDTLLKKNKKAGRVIYSTFRLYDNENYFIDRYYH